MKKIDESYFKIEENLNGTRIEDMLSSDEHVLLQAKPKKGAYVLNSAINLLPFVIIWIIFDTGFIVGMSFAPIPPLFWLFIVPFFILHLTPVWIWITNMIKASLAYKNIAYVFTEKRILLRTGIIGIDYKNIYYSDIIGVNLKVGVIDKMCKVGDIYIRANDQNAVLFDVEQPYALLNKIQKIVFDIKSDIIFPNELRPDTNEGFNTKYIENNDKN